MSDNRILSEKELAEIQVSVDYAQTWGETQDTHSIVKLLDYVKSLQERNTALGLALAGADKHAEWDQHDAWNEGSNAMYSDTGALNPYEARPS